MKYTQNELVAALTILIKKDPIIDFTIDESTCQLRHLSGKVQDFKTPFKEITVNNEITHSVDYDTLKITTREYIDSIKSELVGEAQSVDYTLVEKMLDEKIQSIKLPEPTVNESTTIIKRVEVSEEYDNSIRKFVTTLIEDVSKRLSEIENAPVEAVEPLITPEMIDERIDQFNADFTARFDEFETKKRYVVGMATRLGTIVLIYNDGEEVDITHMVSPNIHYVGGGGGSSSSSAEVITPRPGEITYNAEGKVSQIITGSKVTTIIRDTGVVVGVNKGSYRKMFTRDAQGKITGWNIIYNQ